MSKPSPEINPLESGDAMSNKLPGLRGGSAMWIAVLASLVVILWFFCFEVRYGPGHVLSTLDWLQRSWNPVTDYEHGILIPFVIFGLLAYRFKEMRAAVQPGSAWGYFWILVGCLFYVAGYRTLQPRIAVGGLPFILWGIAYAFWGWRVARLAAFPLFFLWISIPLPAFQQATTQLQLLATAMAHHGSNLLGVETYTQGTTILPVHGDWKPLSIAHGCSGIRSLMALLMISAAWAYVAKIAIWKKILLFLSAFPLAIVGNSLRVISIFVIAEYGNAEWASTTWHDWSGLLLFYPFSLILLLAIHSLLEGGLPWRAKNRRQVRRTVVTPAAVSGATQQP
jgi:exosortase